MIIWKEQQNIFIPGLYVSPKVNHSEMLPAYTKIRNGPSIVDVKVVFEFWGGLNSEENIPLQVYNFCFFCFFL